MELCKDCINYLYNEETKKTSCDFEHFYDIHISKSYIFIPEDFDCDDFEKLKE